MFNLSGTEIIVILLLALVVLGPEKLPEAMRKAGRAYSELRKMANSFQSEMHSVLDEPMEELRGTAEAIRNAANFTPDLSAKPTPPSAPSPPATPAPQPAPPAVEPDPPTIDDVLADDDQHSGERAGTADEDLITRTLSGDVAPHVPPEPPGPEG